MCGSSLINPLEQAGPAIYLLLEEICDSSINPVDRLGEWTLHQFDIREVNIFTTSDVLRIHAKDCLSQFSE